VSDSVFVIDAGALVASVDRSERRHEAVRRIIDGAQRPLITSQIVLAEVDHMLLPGGAPARRRPLHVAAG
jgi:predicted nucleic acid-binding protein